MLPTTKVVTGASAPVADEQQPLVSIVMPVFNEARTLRDRLCSEDPAPRRGSAPSVGRPTSILDFLQEFET